MKPRRKNRSTTRGPLRLYKSYMFRDKDPAIYELKTALADAGRDVNKKGALLAIERAGGPTVSCMKGWWSGTTKRPQNATLEAAGRACGLNRVWVRAKA